MTNEETNETLNILNSCDVLEEEEANPRSLVASKGIDGKLSWLSFHLKISPRKHFVPRKEKLNNRISVHVKKHEIPVPPSN